MLGAVFVGGQVTRNLPRDQTLIFPIGSSFPKAQRFSATWQAPGSKEPSGGVTLSFREPPPLQIRQHAQLPNGDYIVTIAVDSPNDNTARPTNTESDPEMKGLASTVKTTVERRVNLSGGETMIALPASASALE